MIDEDFTKLQVGNIVTERKGDRYLIIRRLIDCTKPLPIFHAVHVLNGKEVAMTNPYAWELAHEGESVDAHGPLYQARFAVEVTDQAVATTSNMVGQLLGLNLFGKSPDGGLLPKMAGKTVRITITVED